MRMLLTFKMCIWIAQSCYIGITHVSWSARKNYSDLVAYLINNFTRVLTSGLILCGLVTNPMTSYLSMVVGLWVL